jgi:outer membrane protein TolC
MPTRRSKARNLTSARRRMLLMVLLVPTAGCSFSLALFKPKSHRPAVQDPGSFAETEDDEQPTVIQTVAQTAAFRTESLTDAALIDAALIDAGQGLAELAAATQGSTSSMPMPVVVPDMLLHGDSAGRASGALAGPQVIDLASALGMAGGSAWMVQLARERTVEAHADLQRAQALWLPTLQFGVGWNKHDGRIQATPGNVIEASRSSLFVGGGATMGSAPIAGGSGGPFRLFADLELAEAFFSPKIARRQLSARRAGVSVARNTALLNAGIAYVDLLESSGRVADAQAAIDSAGELLNLTQTFADAGAGAQADVDRAATEEARLEQRLQDSVRLLRTRSASLSRHLRLDPRFQLQAADKVIVPIDLSSSSADLDSLIRTATAQRPEINELSHEISALCLAVQQEEVAPWIPSVSLTTSAGTFGGGNGTSLDNNGGRSDLDLQAIWELDSLGLGVVADRKRVRSRLAQRRTSLADLRDQVTVEVVTAYEDVANYRTQIDSANRAMERAEASYRRNLQRVRADEGLPIELLQAITARADSLSDRTSAVSNYNRAQQRLLHATGQLRQ